MRIAISTQKLHRTGGHQTPTLDGSVLLYMARMDSMKAGRMATTCTHSAQPNKGCHEDQRTQYTLGHR